MIFKVAVTLKELCGSSSQPCTNVERCDVGAIFTTIAIVLSAGS